MQSEREIEKKISLKLDDERAIEYTDFKEYTSIHISSPACSYKVSIRGDGILYITASKDVKAYMKRPDYWRFEIVKEDDRKPAKNERNMNLKRRG